jgi:hypothetical protein
MWREGLHHAELIGTSFGLPVFTEREKIFSFRNRQFAHAQNIYFISPATYR